MDSYSAASQKMGHEPVFEGPRILGICRLGPGAAAFFQSAVHQSHNQLNETAAASALALGPGRDREHALGAASAGYVSWTGLVDRTYTGRHLPPADRSYVDALPALDKLRPLFQRQQLTPCPKSTALFGFFAQWFTDSFLRTDPNDFRMTTSNHEIDLCQIYGLDAGERRSFAPIPAACSAVK